MRKKYDEIELVFDETKEPEQPESEDDTGIRKSENVHNSYVVNESASVRHSDCVESSNAVSWSSAVSLSYGVSHCNGVFQCAFCHGIDGISNRLFNREVPKERAIEVVSSLKCLWTPHFSDIDDYNDSPWREMPLKMTNYIKSLPEYNEEIFKKITN